MMKARYLPKLNVERGMDELRTLAEDYDGRNKVLKEELSRSYDLNNDVYDDDEYEKHWYDESSYDDDMNNCNIYNKHYAEPVNQMKMIETRPSRHLNYLSSFIVTKLSAPCKANNYSDGGGYQYFYDDNDDTQESVNEPDDNHYYYNGANDINVESKIVKKESDASIKEGMIFIDTPGNSFLIASKHQEKEEEEEETNTLSECATTDGFSFCIEKNENVEHGYDDDDDEEEEEIIFDYSSNYDEYSLCYSNRYYHEDENDNESYDEKSDTEIPSQPTAKIALIKTKDAIVVVKSSPPSKETGEETRKEEKLKGKVSSSSASSASSHDDGSSFSSLSSSWLNL